MTGPADGVASSERTSSASAAGPARASASGAVNGSGPAWDAAHEVSDGDSTSPNGDSASDGSASTSPSDSSASDGSASDGQGCRERAVGAGRAGSLDGEDEGSGGEQDMTTALQATTCSTHQPFTAAEVDTLAALPSPLEDLEPDTWCELESGHSGPHYGFGQISGTQWWWLRWDDTGARELVTAGFCGTHPTRGPGDCTLPDQHTGRHSFELGATD